MKKEVAAGPNILLIEEDEEVREGLRRILEAKGYQVVLAANETECAKALTGTKLEIGLILISQKAGSDEALAAGRRIRTQAKGSDSAPVIVIPNEYVDKMEGKDENVGGTDHKIYMTSVMQLEELLNRLLPFDFRQRSSR